MTDSHYPSTQLVGETERMFSAATGKNCTILLVLKIFFISVEGEMDLPLLLKCHSLQSQVLHRHNMQLAKTCDALAQAHASIGVLPLSKSSAPIGS